MKHDELGSPKRHSRQDGKRNGNNDQDKHFDNGLTEAKVRNLKQAVAP